MGSAGRSTGALVVAGVLALTLPAAFLWGLSTLGVPLLPQSAAASEPEPTATTVRPIVDISDSPAARSLTDILQFGPGLPWVATTTIDRAVNSPLSATGCIADDAPAISSQRTYTDGTALITVTARAYQAGAGAVAFNRTVEQVSSCSDTAAAVTSSQGFVGGNSALVTVVRPESFPSDITVVSWRRGDVVFDVHSGSPPGGQAAFAAELINDRASDFLTPVCVNLDSTADDAVRSPWINRDRYVGLQLPEDVIVPPAPRPTPPPGVPARDPAAALDPIPEVTLPPRPSDPVWPELPAAPPTPVTPASVGPEPTATTATTLRRDESGPGCGWAFTGQAEPPFDQTVAAASNEAVVSAARTALVAEQSEWSAQLVKYWTESAAYDAALGPYRLFAAQVQQVAAAWAALQRVRDDYALALAEWQAQVTARTNLITEQQKAAADYAAAIAACAVTPTPTPTPTPTVTDPFLPTPIPTPTPSLTIPANCPPERPTVLDQTVPPIPPTPTPPPDPRPSPSVSATGSR